MATFKKLTSGLETKYKVYSLLTPVAVIGEVVMEVLIPTIMAKIVDVGIANHDVNYVVRVGLIMVGVSILSLGFGMLSGRFAAVASLGFGKNLRKKLFYKVQDFSFSNMDKFSTASMVTRLTTDVTNAQNTYQMIIRICIRAPIMFITAVIMSVTINPKLSTVFLYAIPFIIIPVSIIVVKAFPRYRKMMEKYDKLNSDVQENLTGIRVVKSFAREDYESEEFDKTAENLRKAQVFAEKLIIMTMPLMQLVMYLSTVAMLFFGGRMIIDSSILTGELVSFITYLSQILMALIMISMIIVMLVMARASIARILEVLDEKVDITDGQGAVDKDVAVDGDRAVDGGLSKEKILPKDGSVIFENVDFSYDKNPDNKVLSNINMDIPSGSTVGIMGGTGSSKTTLVQLIPRLYDTLSGKVMVGGHDVKDYDLKTLRNSVAMVLQKNLLFSGTIEENLRWGDKNATEEEIISACKASSAHEFISSFPQGYKTDLGQGGVNLSGGQKQRLCIARALLKKPKILILDDSTSAVDTATDFSIRKALKTSLKDTTKIIIAQRISSVEDCDKIYVMDEGKIVDSGSHEELLKTSKIYQEVYFSQMKGSEDSEGSSKKEGENE